MKVKFFLENYPKFIEHYRHSSHTSWTACIKADGYKTVERISNKSYEYRIDEVEFTHFALKWS